MKNTHKLLLLLIFSTLFFSCTPNSLNENETNKSVEVFATGGDNSAELDNNKDGD